MLDVGRGHEYISGNCTPSFTYDLYVWKLKRYIEKLEQIPWKTTLKEFIFQNVTGLYSATLFKNNFSIDIYKDFCQLFTNTPKWMLPNWRHDLFLWVLQILTKVSKISPSQSIDDFTILKNKSRQSTA